MASRTLVKIHVTHTETGLPAVGYSIDLLELDNSNQAKVTDSNGDIAPFYMDMDDFIYADIFVRDSDGNVVLTAERQFALKIPETVINIHV